MKDEEHLICNRLLDLANNSYYRNIPVTTDFLDLNSQSLFYGITKDLPDIQWKMTGGYSLAERKLIIFFPEYAPEELSGYYSIIKIEPATGKFESEHTHRDYLGAIMNLGISRSKTGDILVTPEGVFLFCAKAIEEYIVNNLTTVRHTFVRCSVVSFTDFRYEPSYNEIKGSISSLRLDSIIALGFNSSRSHLINYIEEGKIAVNGRIITSNAYRIKPGDIISVRGLGKIRFINEISATKKGRLMVLIHKYI